MAVTISDIAHRVGVTTATVSKVLNNSSSGYTISAQTRRKVLQAVEELDYRPSFSARSLSRGKTFSIGFECGGLDNPFVGEVATHALLAAKARGYHLMMNLTSWETGASDLECLDDLLARGVDGVIFYGLGLGPGTPIYEKILRKKIPLVRLQWVTAGLSCVATRWEVGMLEAVGYLKQKGHRRIGFVRCNVPVSSPDPEYPAFLSVCRDLNVEPKEIFVSSDIVSDGRKIARMADRPSAVIVSSELVAMGILKGFQEEGLKIPSDISMMSIEGTQMGGLLHPGLTSLSQQSELLARTAIDQLIRLIEKQEEPGRVIYVPTKLIVRESA